MVHVACERMIHKPRITLHTDRRRRGVFAGERHLIDWTAWKQRDMKRMRVMLSIIDRALNAKERINIAAAIKALSFRTHEFWPFIDAHPPLRRLIRDVQSLYSQKELKRLRRHYRTKVNKRTGRNLRCITVGALRH